MIHEKHLCWHNAKIHITLFNYNFFFSSGECVEIYVNRCSKEWECSIFAINLQSQCFDLRIERKKNDSNQIIALNICSFVYFLSILIYGFTIIDILSFLLFFFRLHINREHSV